MVGKEMDMQLVSIRRQRCETGGLSFHDPYSTGSVEKTGQCNICYTGIYK